MKILTKFLTGLVDLLTLPVILVMWISIFASYTNRKWYEERKLNRGK